MIESDCRSTAPSLTAVEKFEREFQEREVLRHWRQRAGVMAFKYGLARDEEDLFHEWIALVWRYRERIAALDPEKGRAYCLRILRNVMNDASNQRRERGQQTALDAPGGEPGVDVLTGIEQRILIEQLLERLNPTDRAIARARLREVPWEILAQLEGIATNALTVRILRRLKKVMKETPKWKL